MVKVIASVILTLSFLLLLREAFISVPTEDGVDGGPAVGKSKRHPVVPQEKSVPFYPPVPTVLPDLNLGYLFNAERFLPGEKDSAASAEEAGEAGTEVTVDIETVFYAGSIIAGDVRKGLIVYPALAGPATPVKKGEPVAAASSQKPRKYAQLAPGDTVSGYSVVAVEADRLVLQKGEETIEKLLNDPKKERIAPPPPPKPQAAPKPAPAPAAKPAVTRAAGVSSAVGRTPPQRINAPRRLPANMSIQVPGTPR